MDEYKGSINAQITNSVLEYTSEVEGAALSKWGFSKVNIEKALHELQTYRDTGLTPEEIRTLKEYLDMSRSEVQGLSRKLVDMRDDRDYWKAEALKHCAKLGEIKLLMGRSNG